MPFRRIHVSAVSLLLALAFAASLVPQGCAPALRPEPEWEKNARAQIEQAETMFAKRQYDQAAKAADAFFTLYPQSRYADRALIILGETRLARRDYRQALSYYKEIIEKHPASSLAAEAKYKLGLCYFELKEYDLAEANLEDRGKITDPVKLQRISEMLSSVYVIEKNYPKAVKEYVYLAQNAQNEQQRAGYRDRVREIVEKYLSEDELRTLSAGAVYPSDIARLRLAALLIEKRKYRDAIDLSREFLERFPSHPEKTRAEMLLNEATLGLTGPKYYIGALLPQTGQFAYFGDRVLKGIQLAVHTFNLQEPDNRVELIVKDTEGSPEKAVAALGELASKGVVAVIGPVTTREEEAIAPSLEKLQVPVIRPAASRAGFSVKSAWIFRNALTIDSEAAAIAQYALDLKLKRFVIFYPDEPYGKDLARLFARGLERRAEVLASVAYPPETRDFGPYIKKIIEIDLRSRKISIPEDDAERKKLFEEYTPGFDAVYLPGYAERVGLIIPQLAFYNISGKVLLGSDNWHSRDLIERAGRYADGAIFTDGFFPESADPAIKSVVDAYRSAYQEDPDILSAQAYDAAMMVFSLLKEHKDTPVAVRDSLLALKNFAGISGSTTFAGNGEAQKKIFFITVDDGKFVLLDNGK
jgi:branched-chain amino acid transport system substrate-binding protein